MWNRRAAAFWRVDIADGTVSKVCDGIGGGCYFDWDSKGNIYGNGGIRTSPDGKKTPFIKGFLNCIPVAIDSHDNLYISDYNKAPRTYKIPLNKVTDDMLPIVATYQKDGSGKVDITVTPDFKPAGLVIEMQKNVGDAYSFNCDAWGNCYFTQNGKNIIWKYSPEGKVRQLGLGAAWARYACPDANGEFFHLGFDIIKVAANGQRIGMFAPATDLNHSVAIDLDAQGNLYQSQPSEFTHKQGVTTYDEKGTPLDPESRGIIYKYTPDGRRSVLAYVGLKPFGVRIMPKNKYPLTKPAE